VVKAAKNTAADRLHPDSFQPNPPPFVHPNESVIAPAAVLEVARLDRRNLNYCHPFAGAVVSVP